MSSEYFSLNEICQKNPQFEFSMSLPDWFQLIIIIL
jgi:hypothetical protein